MALLEAQFSSTTALNHTISSPTAESLTPTIESLIHEDTEAFELSMDEEESPLDLAPSITDPIQDEQSVDLLPDADTAARMVNCHSHFGYVSCF